jgi:3HB-oligomer hydrolase 3HBOH/tannase/feruloyl esterase
MFLRLCGAVALLFVVSLSARAAVTCADVLAAIGSQLADVTCFASTDLTTNNEQTTPADNSNPALPPFAFTPRTDRNVISPNAPDRTPISGPVPGLQIQARIASDPLGQARFLLRLPSNWNGRLVVAGASGTRSEFNGDYAWSDYVVQKGYAYASQNKGVYNLRLSNSADPLACRLNPDSGVYVHFYDNDAGQFFTRWAEYMIKAAQLARSGVQAAYGQAPRYNYAVGTSNGGYQVRRAVELAPDTFDGGVDWEGTFVSEEAPNLLTDLPAAILNFPDYRASGFSAATTAAKNIQAAGYPPDIRSDLGATPTTLWNNNWNSFWEVTQCQWQKRLDPAYDTYGSGTGTYNYVNRLSYSDVGQQMENFSTSGKIQRPLVTVAGTMDALLPIDHHARAYARKVGDAAKPKHGANAQPYRLYEIQNGNHIENYKQLNFSKLEFIQPHAQHAFDLLVQQVELGRSLPPSQCVARGGSISDAPAQPGHCASFFVP